MTSVRNSNLGLCFFPFKCCVSQLSGDRFGNNFGGLMILGQVRSSPNFCSFGPQRAEKRNIWRRKNTNLNLNSGLCQWTRALTLPMHYHTNYYLIRLVFTSLGEGWVTHLHCDILESDRSVGGDVDAVLSGVEVHSINRTCLAIWKETPRIVVDYSWCCDHLQGDYEE